MSIITVYVRRRAFEAARSDIAAWSLARVRELSAAPVCSRTHSRYSGDVGRHLLAKLATTGVAEYRAVGRGSASTPYWTQQRLIFW